MVDQVDIVEAFKSGRVEGITLSQPPIQTHISLIFLTDTHAYKLKRAVTLPFLDFGTLDQRLAACQAEFNVNQRLAGPLYEGVAPLISLGDGRFQIGGNGEPVDWLVVMKRFPKGAQFDELADAGELTDELLTDTARVIAQAHANSPATTSTGHATDYRAIINELRETEAQAAAQQGLKIASEPLFALLDTELTRLDHLIETRRKTDKVRRCHGDLHLRNMCLFHGVPTMFDALEFDEHLATTDLLYDMGYLLMDLVRIGDRRGANLVLNAYWDDAREDETGLKLLPFFMALRAAVRMAVGVAAEHLDEAAAYRKLATNLAHHIRPIAVAIGGLSGVGKSTIARELAARLPGPAGGRWLRSDVLRKQETDAPDYSDNARNSVYDQLFEKADAAFKTGASVIMDATFQSTEQAERAVTLPGFPAVGLWLDAPLEVRLSRVSERDAGPSDADITVARAQREPDPLPAGWHIVDASGSAEETLANALIALGLPTA